VTTVLILGGTGEARRLAAALIGRYQVISSLAGRVRSPLLPPGLVRIGGFGGVPGLRSYLASAGIDAVVDATHPFAAQMSFNASAACSSLGVPLVSLRRPAWEPSPGDQWIPVPSVADAARALDSLGSRVLLTTGRQELAAFAGCDRHWFLVRCVNPPIGPRPARCEILLDRGPFTVEGELFLLRAHSIDVLVTKNSGGALTSAKLAAARSLGLPVVMVSRPPSPPSVPAVPSVAAALSWLSANCSPDPLIGAE
jgi:precorrin-6A/cobalt-precorrin-6A reductase